MSSYLYSGTSGSNRVQQLIDEIKQQKQTQDLYSQVQRNQAKVAALGGPKTNEISAPHPTLLHRIFGLLSAPLHAVTSFAHNEEKAILNQHGDITSKIGAALNPVNLTKSLGHAGEGLFGKEHYSTANLLQDAGVHNKWVKGIAGFAGDVLLDPLTYLSLGTSGALKGAEEANAAKNIIEGIGKNALSHTPEEALLAARNVAEHEGIFLGKSGKGLTSFIKKSEKEASINHAVDMIHSTLGAEKAAQPGALQLKLLGKPLVESKALYQAGAAGKAAFKATSAGNLISEAFNTAHRVPRTILEKFYNVEGAGYAHLHDYFNSAIRSTFKGIDSETGKRLINHIENGTIDQLGGKEAAWAKSLQHEFKNIFDEEVKAGVISPDQFRQNYVPHIFRNKNADELVNRLKKQFGSEVNPFAKGRKFEDLTIEEIKGLASKKNLPLNIIDNPVELLLRRMMKHQDLFNRKNFVQDAIAEWGIHPDKTKNFTGLLKKANYVKSKSIFAQGHYLPSEIENSLQVVEKMNRLDPASRSFLKLFDSVQGKYKLMVTAVNPGFHIRNLMGDVWNSYLDGVVNPRNYEQAAKVLSEHGNVAIKVGERTVPRSKILELFQATGNKTGFHHTESLLNALGMSEANKLSRGLEVASRVPRAASEYREDFARMAHFIDSLQKEGKKLGVTKVGEKELLSAAQNAAVRVRKFHYNYRDLTPFEQKFMRRVVPFYTFMRKNIPLQMEMLATKPGRVAALPKGLKAIEQIFGQPQMPGEPLPGLEGIAPQWLREMGAVRLHGEGVGKNSKFFAPQLPITEAASLLSGIASGNPTSTLRDVLARTSPAISTPFELATGTKLFTGQSTKNQTFLDFMSRQVPYQQANQVAPGNFLKTIGRSIGLQEVKPTGIRGEMRREQDVLNAIFKKLKAQRGMA